MSSYVTFRSPTTMTEKEHLLGALELLKLKYQEEGNGVKVLDVKIGGEHPTFTRMEENQPYELNYRGYDDMRSSHEVRSTSNVTDDLLKNANIKRSEDFLNRVIGAYNLDRQMKAIKARGFSVSEVNVTQNETIVQLVKGGF